jgi:nicotinamidase-related amidase
MEIVPGQTALVVTDPQNDFLAEGRAAWEVVKASVQENDTIANLERLFETAKRAGIPLVISPHYYYPHDEGWRFGGPLEKLMHEIDMFERKGRLSVEGLSGSGADWLPRDKRFIEDDETIVTSPHKIYGPEANDLVLQLRKRGIDRVILAGMSANLCVESHLRELLEQGFQVAVVRDATAAARVPEGDGYQAALTNFRFIANDVLSTREAVEALRQAAGTAEADGGRQP